MKTKSVKIGKKLVSDKNVIIGYKAGRNIADRSLTIGANAKLRSGTVIYQGSRIGDSLETGHNVTIREENRIGDGFNIWNNSTVDYGCKIGNDVHIHCNCYIAQFTTIEDGVFMAPGVTIANDMHPGCKNSRKCMKGPTIEKGVQIGVNATILPFVRIGRHSLIGAGSVVTKDIPPYSVVYGNPGKPARKVTTLKCVTGLSDKPYDLVE